jgi:hypothetical protein
MGNLKFKIVTAPVTKTRYFSVQSTDDAYATLENLTSHDWTSAIAQQIIDSIQKSKDTGEKYEWANDDIFVMADGDGVFFWDKQARRADKNLPTKQDLQLTHQAFIDIMNDFKAFIEENS